MKEIYKYLDKMIEETDNLVEKKCYKNVMDAIVIMMANGHIEYAYTKNDLEAMFCVGLLNKPNISVDEMSEVLDTAHQTIDKAIEYFILAKSDGTKRDVHRRTDNYRMAKRAKEEQDKNR